MPIQRPCRPPFLICLSEGTFLEAPRRSSRPLPMDGPRPVPSTSTTVFPPSNPARRGTDQIAAELAAEKASGPASFKERLFDCLYNLDRETVDRMQRIELRQR